MSSNFFKKIMYCALAAALFTLAVRLCSNSPELSSNNEVSSSPIATTASSCRNALPKGSVREDKSSKDVEAEGDKLEGHEALNKYQEANILYAGELGYAIGRNMKGDPSALMELNKSVASAEFSFKVGRAFAKTGKHEIAIACFTESLREKIDKPNDASAYLNRAEAYIAIGQKTKAIADLKLAANLFEQYKLPQYQKLATDRLRSITP
jgi:tetratricopeptide (TPR) repeat protein